MTVTPEIILLSLIWVHSISYTCVLRKQLACRNAIQISRWLLRNYFSCLWMNINTITFESMNADNNKKPWKKTLEQLLRPKQSTKTKYLFSIDEKVVLSDQRCFWCLWLHRAMAVPAVRWGGPEKVVQFLMTHLKCKEREWRNGFSYLTYMKGPWGKISV